MPSDSDNNPKGTVNQDNKPKKKKWPLILLLVLVVLAGSAAGWYFFFRDSPDAEPLKSATVVGDKVVYETGTKEADIKCDEMALGEVILVNLSGSNSYIRVGVVLKYPQANKKLAAELKEKESQLRDAVITYLRTMTYADVAPAGAGEALKQNLLVEINKNLRTGDVVGILWTDFLVQ